MEEKELKAADIPSTFELCFNDNCAYKDDCMHYQAKLLVAGERYKGAAIYPTAWKDGNCRYYKKKQMVQKAWGFSQLYSNIPSYLRAQARRNVSLVFGNGNGPYYRAHNGETMLSPERQKEIMEVLKQYGSTEGVKFDHYVKVWDFD